MGPTRWPPPRHPRKRAATESTSGVTTTTMPLAVRSSDVRAPDRERHRRCGDAGCRLSCGSLSWVAGGGPPGWPHKLFWDEEAPLYLSNARPFKDKPGPDRHG